MVKKVSSWFGENQIIVGSIITLLIYGIGLYIAVSDKVSANTTKDAVYQEKVDQHDKRINSIEATLKDINDAVNRIDKNVVEIKTEVKYKKDKGDK